MSLALLSSPVLIAMAGGALSALLYLSVVSGSAAALLLGYLSPLPLFMIGLVLGNRGLLVAGAVGTVTVTAATGGTLAAGVYIITAALPVFLLVHQALLARPAPVGAPPAGLAPDGGHPDDGHLDGGLPDDASSVSQPTVGRSGPSPAELPGGLPHHPVEWYPAGLLMASLTGLAVASFAAALAVTAGENGGLKGVIGHLLSQMLQEGISAAGVSADLQGAAGITTTNMPEIVDVVALVFPAAVAGSWMLMMIINSILAQLAVMRLGRSLRPPLRLSELELPGWFPLPFALAGAGAVLLPDEGSFIALNLLIILAVPFSFSGLAVIHAFARTRVTKVAILVGFYLSLSLFGWPALAVIGLGVIEQWVGLRRRYVANSLDRE